MKAKLCLLMLVSWTACVVIGCASATITGVPDGSVLVGVYHGTFIGAFNEGSVKVKLYRSPNGGTPFFGNFGEEESYLDFKGEMTAAELQGQILLPLEGTIAGKLSADGQALSGTYKFTVPPFDHGTWQARKQ
jgi:sigma54-dependent transcription regulator